jgi:hypothetical protein
MTKTEVESQPAGYDYRSFYKNLRLVLAVEEGVVYTASDEGGTVLISDETTLLDILGETGHAISIRRFASEEEREAYIHGRFGAHMRHDRVDENLVKTGLSADLSMVSGNDVARPAGSFKLAVRARQAAFRATLPAPARTITDARWDNYDFLLALGHEDETLYPTLRGAGGARDYFRARGARWWRGSLTGDPKGDGPTRNLTSSQVACVNLLLPLREHPSLLAAMLRTVDAEIEAVTRIELRGADDQAISSFVELEWTGRMGTLEGRGSRGANATSADACLIGVTSTGERRAFLLEFKYTESYSNDKWRGKGEKGAERRAKYAERYAESTSCFSGVASLDDVLYEPFYQIVRLGLLGDAMRADRELGLAAARVVVVCPEENSAYRNRITSPPLRRLFPDATTVAEVARRLWKQPDGFCMIDPRKMVEAARASGTGADLDRWSDYMGNRYGW